MDNRASAKQNWKEFFKIYTKIKVPWHLYIISYLAQFVLTTIDLKFPLYTRNLMEGKIFDSKVVWGYIGLFVAWALVKCVQVLSSAIADVRTKRNMRNTIWSKLIRIPMSYFNKEKPSGLISRVTSDAEEIIWPIKEITNLVDAIYGLAGTVIIMYGINKQLTLLLLPMIPWSFLVTWFFGRFFFTVGARVQNSYAAMTGFFSERLSSIRLIKSFGAEDKEIKEGFEAIENRYKAAISYAKLNLISDPFFSSIDIGMTLIIFIVGGSFAAKGSLTVADLIAFYMYIEELSPRVSMFIGSYQIFKESQGATNKIAEILEGKSETFERKKSFNIPDSDIKLENIAFGYDQKEVLSDLSFTIPKGRVTAIVGLNGAGKTTILSLLERFYEPKCGRIMFGDTPAEDIHLNEWRKAFGYVSQNSPLLFGTIRENICYGVNRDISEDEVIRAAKLANAYDFIQGFPDGFETEVGEIGGKLSGGERQRIAIARAIIKDPDYLLLDEATCNLDACSEKVVQEALKNLMNGRTTVVIAHNMSTIINADQIVVIDEGKVKGIGKHKELYNDNSLYREFVDLQAVCECV